MAIRNLINIPSSPITLADLNGITIAANATIDGSAFGLQTLVSSNSVATELMLGSIVLSDGTNTYTKGQAIDILRGLPLNVSNWGTEIITNSDMPTGTNVYWTGAADGTAEGNGDPFTFNVPPGETQVVNATFLTDIWLKQGEVYYIPSNDIGSYINVQIVVPAGLPFPAPAHNGNYDIVNGTPVANTANTGAYFITDTETIIYNFINHYPLIAFGHGGIQSPTPAMFPPGYQIRMTVFNGGTTNLIAAVVLFMYR